MLLLNAISINFYLAMPPTKISQQKQKQRKPRRDKLPLSEKHTRHLEASRNYYARYTLS